MLYLGLKEFSLVERLAAQKKIRKRKATNPFTSHCCVIRLIITDDILAANHTGSHVFAFVILTCVCFCDTDLCLFFVALTCVCFCYTDLCLFFVILTCVCFL